MWNVITTVCKSMEKARFRNQYFPNQNEYVTLHVLTDFPNSFDCKNEYIFYVRCHLRVCYLFYVLHVYGTRLFLLALAENVTSLGPHVNCIHTNTHHT